MTTETNAAATTEGTTEKKVTKLDKLHKEWVDGGKKRPNMTEGKKLVDAYLAADKAKRAAEESFERAKKTASDAAEAIVRTHGKMAIRDEHGDKLVPMCREDTVFFRGESSGEVVDYFSNGGKKK